MKKKMAMNEEIYYLWNNYIMEGKSISQICEYNAEVAREIGKDYLAKIWL
jgi:hypothetical protein